MTWVPRSERLSGEYQGPYEGVPHHLHGPLMDWLSASLDTGKPWQGRVIRRMAMRLRIPIGDGVSDSSAFAALTYAANADDDTLFDILDGTLFITAAIGWDERAEALRDVLAASGSVLTVNKEGTALVEAVSREAQEVYDAATSENDDATTDLQEAWTKAYGRAPDPSDAWDHAIKAAEHVLVPVVEPKNARATLGRVIGHLNGQSGAQWEMVLPGDDQTHDVAPLVSMLRLLWPNHDRHGGQTPREPTLEEAKAVVSLAAMIVQWHRQGWVVRRRQPLTDGS